jgi:PAS domain S-box-containing protein
MVDTENLILQNEYLTREVKRQTQEVQVHMDRMSALNQVASIVSQSLDLDKTLDTALRAVTRVCNAEAGGISLIDNTTDEVVLRAQLGWENDFTNPPMRVPAGKGMSGTVIKRDDVLVIGDLSGEHDVAVPSFREEPFQSIAMAPMHARGKIIGILSIMGEKADAFDAPTVDILRTVADTVGVALDNASLYEQSIENQNRLTAILQSSADGIIATDHNGFVSMMNPSAERMLQVEVSQAINKQLRDVEMARELQEPLRVALSSRDESPEKSFQVKLGDGRYLLVFVSPVWEGDNTIMSTNRDGWVIVLHDVTYLREAEEMKAQFIQAAAHDMRNPIGVTMTSLGTLQRIATDDLSQEIIDIALSGVNRLQTLIDDLLHLERIEHGHIFNMQDTDITELLYEVVEQMRPLVADKNQTCAVDIQGDLGRIHADAHWISRAIINYVSNAVKYTDEGSHIILRAFSKADRIHIEVSDNGPGIPLEVQSRLFERFYQVKSRTSHRGSGLGLAIVKSVVESHGGGVYMRSRVGEGSTFGMTLPILSD